MGRVVGEQIHVSVVLAALVGRGCEKVLIRWVERVG